MRKLLKKYLLYALGAMCLTGCGTTGKADAAGSVLAPAEYMKMLQSDKKAYLLDVRRADEYAAGHLPGAALLDVTDSVAFARGVELLDKEKNIYIYCRSGRRSKLAAKQMSEAGYQVTELKGGIGSWQGEVVQ